MTQTTDIRISNLLVRFAGAFGKNVYIGKGTTTFFQINPRCDSHVEDTLQSPQILVHCGDRPSQFDPACYERLRVSRTNLAENAGGADWPDSATLRRPQEKNKESNHLIEARTQNGGRSTAGQSG